MAVLKEDIPIIQLVLECEESLINKQDKDGNTSLHLAVVSGRADIVQTLLFFYPDMEVKNHQGESVLHFAAKHHAWDMFLMLCNNGATPDEGARLEDLVSVDSWLVMAYRDRHIEALEWLLERGGDWNDIDMQVIIHNANLVCFNIAACV